MDTEERFAEIEALVAPILQALGLFLVDIEWRRTGRRGMLRFFIDKAGPRPEEFQAGPGGVSITDCQRFSEEVGDLLDVSGLVPDGYDLEVSSPGLDRELRKDRELRWAIGRAVRCWLREPLDGQTECSGRLQAVTEEALIVEEPGGRALELPRTRVAKARLELPFPKRRGRRSGVRR
ncbi:MAG: ribosome maturation factor RimP [Candidatus Methylomirabilia bacterium]